MGSLDTRLGDGLSKEGPWQSEPLWGDSALVAAVACWPYGFGNPYYYVSVSTVVSCLSLCDFLGSSPIFSDFIFIKSRNSVC